MVPNITWLELLFPFYSRNSIHPLYDVSSLLVPLIWPWYEATTGGWGGHKEGMNLCQALLLPYSTYGHWYIVSCLPGRLLGSLCAHCWGSCPGFYGWWWRILIWVGFVQWWIRSCLRESHIEIISPSSMYRFPWWQGNEPKQNLRVGFLHIPRDHLPEWCSSSSPGVGVTKPIFSVPLFFEFFNIIKTHVIYWRSRLYLTGVAAAQLRWHLSNVNVIHII